MNLFEVVAIGFVLIIIIMNFVMAPKLSVDYLKVSYTNAKKIITGTLKVAFSLINKFTEKTEVNGTDGNWT